MAVTPSCVAQAGRSIIQALGAPQTVSNDIEHLNSDCTCVTLDRDALCRAIEKAVADPEFCQALALTHPYLLSAQPVFLTKAHAERMQQIIWAIEAIARLPQYQTLRRSRSIDPAPLASSWGMIFIWAKTARC